MPAVLRRFAINADDAARARAFYERVMGWRFQPWGPPDHYASQLPGIWCGLHHRHELIDGMRTNAFRLSFGVADVHATLAAVTAHGGKVLMKPFQIEGGPEVGYFEDTEGNVSAVGRYKTAPPDGAPRLRHFAINADDVRRARRFYENVFGWTFMPWGPPNFYQTRSVGEGVMGALQERRELVPGQRTNSFETTFEVTDIRATLAAVCEAGGQILMQPFRIEGVGEIGYFQDTEGNSCGLAQYLPGVWP